MVPNILIWSKNIDNKDKGVINHSLIINRSLSISNWIYWFDYYINYFGIHCQYTPLDRLNLMKLFQLLVIKFGPLIQHVMKNSMISKYENSWAHNRMYSIKIIMKGKINFILSCFLYAPFLSSLLTASNVTESRIKGKYYERREISQDSILNSIISSHKNLRWVYLY